MSRTGVEPKPPWRAVPAAVRLGVHEALGAAVSRAARVWGGYGPTPTFRLRLTDGRRAFFKASWPQSDEFARDAWTREERVYRELADVIRPWAPAFYASFQLGGWRVLLLEDTGPRSVPPWTPALASRVMHAFAAFHHATLGIRLPAWIPRGALGLGHGGRLSTWEPDVEALRPMAGLAGARAEEAFRWLETSAPSLTGASRLAADPLGPQAFLHGDTRSDNLRWARGRLRLLDWPSVSVGPPEDDVAMLAQSIAAEGGPEPERLVAWYRQRVPLRPEAMDAAVARTARFFADQAWRPPVPGLPRLRPFQRRQLRVTLSWTAMRLGLPEPTWLQAPGFL